jgi:hypothetical protein
MQLTVSSRSCGACCVSVDCISGHLRPAVQLRLEQVQHGEVGLIGVENYYSFAIRLTGVYNVGDRRVRLSLILQRCWVGDIQ